MELLNKFEIIFGWGSGRPWGLPELFSISLINGCSELAQDAVHHPVGGGGTDAVAVALSLAVQMVNHSLYQRELYMFGVGNVKLVTSLTVMQGYGLECEDREADHAFVANQFNAVLLG